MKKSFLPYGRQSVDEDDIKAVADVLNGDFLTTGPAVSAFETALRDRLSCGHVIACSNGTAALHMASGSLGIGPGDVVIVPAITFLATANGPALSGAKVVFADVHGETGLLTEESLKDALERAGKTGQPKAVFPVHLNGQCVDMKEIHTICQADDLLIIEDAAHAIGGEYRGPDGSMTPVGSCAWSHATTFSFHPVKTIAMGEGGAVTTKDPHTAGKLAKFRNHGMTRDPGAFTETALAFDDQGNPNPWYYEMQSMGHNFRAPDINCALGLSQLGKLDTFIHIRKVLMDHYDQLLEPYAPVIRPVPRLGDQTPAWHIYVVRIDFGQYAGGRARVMSELKERGIGTQVHYIPVSSQPYWRKHTRTPHLPGAEKYYQQVLTLPLHTNMNADDVRFVVRSLTEILNLS